MKHKAALLSFLSDFVREDVLQHALSGLVDGGVELLLGNWDFDLEYVGRIVFFSDGAQAI